uniref:WAP domain-containing protein n=1 Tax=Elaeophora elaphi TaxID=1147741 RepID=A0A0R3RSE4_9BILA
MLKTQKVAKFGKLKNENDQMNNSSRLRNQILIKSRLILNSALLLISTGKLKMFWNRKICLMLAISTLMCYLLLVEGCMPHATVFHSKFIRRGKPCTDARRRKIRVGRNPVRVITVNEYGAHGKCEEDDECLPNIKCKEGCCL